MVRPTTLVLSSGGTRGSTHIGAIQALERVGWITSTRPRTLVGTSAGAIVATLLILGYTPNEMERLVRGVDLNSILGDRGHGGAINMNGLVHLLPTRYGVINSDTARIRKIVRTLILRSRVARGDTSLTFSELYRRTKRRLIVCATDIHASEPIYFCPVRTPNTSIAFALRASMTIPFLFTPLRGRYVDGAFTDHYPFRVSPDDSGRTVGIVILDEIQARRSVASLMQYIRLLIRAVETSRTRERLADPDIHERTIIIPCSRNDTNTNIDAFLQCGRTAANTFIAAHRRRGVLGTIGPSARARLACMISLHKNLRHLKNK